MDILTFALVAVVIILFEFALRTRGKINRAAQEKFEDWKNSYLSQIKEPEEVSQEDNRKSSVES